jgi:thioredoxin reductase
VLEARSPLAEQLGVAVTGGPLGSEFVETDAWLHSTVPGVSAAGDVSSQMPSVANAISAGSTAAAGIVQSLLFEDHGLEPVRAGGSHDD